MFQFRKIAVLTCLFFLLFSSSQAAVKFDGKCSVIFLNEESQNYSGKFSTSEKIKEQEKKYLEYAKRELEIDLKPGMLLTESLRRSYEEIAKIAFEWGTPDNSDFILASLFISDHKIQEGKQKGLHPIRIYNQNEFLDHIELTKFMDNYPNSSFYLSNELWQRVHKLGGSNILPWAQWMTRNLGLILKPIGLDAALYSGGGEFRKFRTRVFGPHHREKLSQEQMDNILGFRDELIALGFFPKALESEESLKDYSILPTHWSNFHRKPKQDLEGNFNSLMSYPSPKIIEEAMESIYDWANKEMKKMDNGEPGARDPIEIAALVHAAMIYIHPAKDGNGRVARAFKNKILEKYGLPPDVKHDRQNLHDLDLGVEGFVQSVREGVFYAVNLMGTIEPSKPPSVIDSKIGIEVSKSAINGIDKLGKKFLSDNALPKSAKEVFVVGGNIEKDLIFRGNFFQGKFGVSWQYVPEEGKLYPINDWTASLYGLGGDLYVKDTGKNRYNFRMPNEVFHKHMNDNIKLFRSLIAYKADPTNPMAIDPKSIEVVPFEDLLEMDKGFGHFKFYPYQAELVNAALKSELDPTKYPIAVLSPTRGNHVAPTRSGPTDLQLDYVFGKETYELGSVMGAYQLRRIYLLRLEKDLKDFYPEIYQRSKVNLDKAKKDAYIAARTILEPMANFINEVFTKEPGTSLDPRLADSDFHTWAKGHAFYIGMKKYMDNQEWAYESYEIAKDKVDQSFTFVIRNISDLNLKVFGLRTELQQAEFLRKWAPFLESVAKEVDAEIKRSNREKRPLDPKNLDKWLSRKLATFVSELDASGNPKDENRKDLRKKLRDGIDKAVEGVFADYYQSRGEELEFSRPFVDLFLHLSGFHPQEMKSTTVNPFYNWFLNAQNQLKFYPSGESIFYRVKIGEEAVDAIYSPYTAQNEVVESTNLSPSAAKSRIIFKASEVELKLTGLSGNETGKFDSSWLKRMGSKFMSLFKSEERKLALAELKAQAMAEEAKRLEPYGLKTYKIFKDEMNYKVESSEVLIPESTPVFDPRTEFINTIDGE